MSNPEDNESISNEGKQEVEMFNRVNRLKIKAGGDANGGPGQFDQSKIESANTVITQMSSLYPKEIKNVLNALDKEWVQLNVLNALDKESGPEDNEEEKKRLIKSMSNTANQIKDLAGTFGYTLMQYFGNSLCSYILKTDLNREEHFIIVQAHVDVMGVTFREGLKDDDGDGLGEELKITVQKAIDKYD